MVFGLERFHCKLILNIVQNLDHLIQDLVVENTKLQQELETASERERTSDLTVSGSDNMIRKQTVSDKSIHIIIQPLLIQ